MNVTWLPISDNESVVLSPELSCSENVVYMQATSVSDFRRQNIPTKLHLSGIT